MAKKKAKAKTAKGDQIPLIDVAPVNAVKIIAAGRELKKIQRERCNLTAKEVAQKHKFLDLVHEAKLVPLKDGTTKFQYDGVTVCVTPSEEKVRITEEV